ncbi:hypothetical protein [Desulfurobacterium indicum]|uniref:Cytochrome c7-like domain-containing protein n=1 Tax=Desulfurobacterium indicum TaxID=1914305 RepID=A0A1R1MM83_9BACT|nr:hypothetical protein [Desulfurobacterium indicum]OMH40887.1 hypothetical protein BLW93_02960 [Desulfurobacterium indicum]
MKKVLFLSAMVLFAASCGTVQTKPAVEKPTVENKTQEVKPEKKVEAEIKPKVTVPEEELTLSKFRHKDHMVIIKKYGCLPCHHFNVEMHIPDVKRAKVVSQKFLKPGVASCKACHTQGVKQ